MCAMETKNFSLTGFCRTDISVWTARARIDPEDLPQDVISNMPPDKLASLGSKKLFPVEALRPFLAVKAAAYKLCNSYGTKFMGGYCVPKDRMQSLDLELQSLSYKFEQHKQTFLNDYARLAEQWVTQFPEWETMLRRAIPSITSVAGRFSFNWQMFIVADPEFKHDGLDKAKAVLAEDTMSEILEELADIKPQLDKAAASGKFRKDLFNRFDILHQKLEGLAMLNPALYGLNELLTTEIQWVKTAGTKEALSHLCVLIGAMQDRSVLDGICNQVASNAMKEGDAFAAILDAGNVSQPQTAHEPDPVLEEQAAKGEPIFGDDDPFASIGQPVAQPEPVKVEQTDNDNLIDAGGLW